MSENNGNKNSGSDLSVKAEEYLEIISTEDERIKIIGEELANDTGRAIFGKISQGIASSNDLAKILNISLPLINWHINRLLSVGLVKVEKIELSSKNKQMKYYGPVKTALVIIPPEEPVNNGNNSNPRRASVLLKLRQYMASFIALAISAPIIYTIQKSTNTTVNSDIPQDAPSEQQMMMKATESVESARSAAPPLSGGVVPESSVFASEPMMILIALLGSAAVFLGGFLITRFYLKRKKKTIVRQEN